MSINKMMKVAEHSSAEKSKFLAQDLPENALDTILETLGDARWTIWVSEGGTIETVHWSDEMRRLLGYHSEADFPDLLSSWFNLLHPDDIPPTNENLYTALLDPKKETRYDIEYRLKCTDGQYRWFRAIGKYGPPTAPDAPRLFYGILTSIDAQKRHEAEIQQNLRVMSVLNKDYTAIYFVDLDQNTYTAYMNSGNQNESASEIIQANGVYTTTIEQCIVALVSPDDRAWLSRSVQPQMVIQRMQKENEFAIRYRCAEPELIGQENFEMRFVTSQNTPEHHQVVIGFRCIDHILEEERQMKLRLEAEHQAKDYQRHLILHNALRSCMWGFDFNRDGRLFGMDCGQAFCVMMGLHSSDLPLNFEKCYARIHPDDRQRIVDASQELLKHPDENRQYIGEFRIVQSNGSYRWFHVSGKVFQLSGGHYSFTGVLTDIDEEKRLQNSLAEEVVQLEKTRDELKKALEEAKHANMAKTDFLRRMSHDIRTPINGIRGMVEIENHYPDDVQKLKECRGKIWEASGYLLSLVNNVLDMNKLESGSIDLKNDPFDLFQLLTEIQTILEIQANEVGIHFQMMLDPQQFPHRNFLGSPTYIKQILVNLASNAIKYNREGGKVSLSCRELSHTDSSVEFEFICADTGIGMSEEFQKRAFEPFSQEKKDARSTFTGSGLGLSITRNLIECMGGTILLESQENVGTTFTVTLPFQIDQAPSAPEAAVCERTFPGRRALLVEDNSLNMEIALFLLENLGFEVTCVTNGRKALDCFAASEPGTFDVIFMDIMMPVMNGLEASKEIRSLTRADAASIPIFAMTANAFQDDYAESIRAGMNEHLTKPLDRTKIISALTRYLAD